MIGLNMDLLLVVYWITPSWQMQPRYMAQSAAHHLPHDLAVQGCEMHHVQIKDQIDGIVLVIDIGSWGPPATVIILTKKPVGVLDEAPPPTGRLYQTSLTKKPPIPKASPLYGSSHICRLWASELSVTTNLPSAHHATAICHHLLMSGNLETLYKNPRWIKRGDVATECGKRLQILRIPPWHRSKRSLVSVSSYRPSNRRTSPATKRTN